MRSGAVSHVGGAVRSRGKATAAGRGTPAVGVCALKLELRGITKRFGDLVANDHIDLTVEPGEVHALLSASGAGKSTLMNQPYGLPPRDEGECAREGEARTFRSPRDAIAAGIGMVHELFMEGPVFIVG